jgi:hypothetical protein
MRECVCVCGGGGVGRQAVAFRLVMALPGVGLGGQKGGGAMLA